jgi:hypothetical protein
MKKYKVVSKNELSELEAEVTKMLNEGWQLAGGLSMAYKHEHSDHGHIPGHLVYTQSLFFE